MATKYPDKAGWKGNKSTGIKAAFAVSKDMGRRHAEVLSAYAPFGATGTTCDQIGEILGLPVHLVRPRASELERKGKLFPVGKAMGAYGHKVTVHSVVKPAGNDPQGDLLG
jgi:hypothetical protein